MNQFKDVPTSQLKKQIRAIYTDIEAIEEEQWVEDEDTGKTYIDPAATYISDLSEHAQKIKYEIARRWYGKPEKKEDEKGRRPALSR